LPTYMDVATPKVVVTHGETEYDLSNKLIQAEIIMRENAVDVGTVVLSDINAELYNAKVDEDDGIKISIKDADEETYTTLLDGVTTLCIPALPLDVLTVKCDGAGYPLLRMVCGEQYGVESKNPAVDTLYEVISDATHGIVSAWVNKLGIDGGESGYSLTGAQDLITGTISYLYFPFIPCHKAVNDACEVVQAIKGASAGPHWIVSPNKHFLLSTVANHSGALKGDPYFWYTYYGNSQENATFVQGTDFTTFNFQKLAKEANYILYSGRLRKPGGGDKWTENAHASWADGILNAAWTATFTSESGAGLFRVGSNSLEACGDTVGSNFDFAYPNPAVSPWAWDTTKMGGEHNIPTVSLYVYADSNVDLTGDYPCFRLFKYNAGPPIFFDDYYINLGPTASNLLTANKWVHLTFPIGPYWRSTNMDFVGWYTHNSPNWNHIDGVHFQCDSIAEQQGKMYIDGLQFNGWVLRGARQESYTTADPCRMKVITDDEAKNDSLVASDDSGTIARLAYAEYLRCKTTPRVGCFTVRLLKDLWPGMLVHPHAKKTNGTFRIDDDFRVTKLVHTIVKGGFFTTVYVTDDVTNSHARPAFNELNKVLKAVRPEFQDRQATSIKMREIDITQPILEKSY